MNKIFNLFNVIALVIIVTGFTFAQTEEDTWTQVDLGGSESEISAISFANDMVGIAVSYWGDMWKTVDGGETWTAVDYGEPNVLYVVHAFDENHYMVFNESAQAMFTTDGGDTWTISESATGGLKSCVKMLSEDVVLAGGMRGRMAKSTDGGNTWSWSNTSYTANIEDILVIDENTVLHCVSTFGLVRKSTDAGDTWTDINTNTGGLTSMSLLPGSSTIAYAFGDTTVIKTTDAGDTWTEISDNPIGSYKRGYFFNEEVGVYASAAGNIYMTEDGGTTWELSYEVASGEEPTYNLFALPTGETWVCGMDGKLIFHNFAPILPVELTSLSAIVNDNAVSLTWTTATEVNNKGFEVQRSSDNENFESVAFVSGYGSTTETQYYNYTDNHAVSGTSYYRLKQIDFDGSFDYSQAVEVEFMPSNYSLEQNYPNPFNPGTHIRFTLPVDANVKISVYNVTGELVKEVINENFTAGVQNISFNAGELASGMYIYQINATGVDGSNFVNTRKMTLLK